MNAIRPLPIVLSALVLAPACSVPALAATRSTRYDGARDAWVRHGGRSEFDLAVAMTVEAWVYREDASRREVVVSHDRRTSYALELAPRLRFSRSGGAFAEAVRTVPAGKWTHVAASYDGDLASFFIDGEAAGFARLSHAGAGADDALWIGGDPSDSAGFLGSIDEVRIWSTARSMAEIRENMFREIREAEDLAAVFPSGGAEIVVPGETGIVLAGSAGGGARPSGFGVLPRDLQVPRLAEGAAITMDGIVDVAGEYLGAETLVVRHGARIAGVRDTVAYLVHDDTDLYIGVRDLWLPDPASDPDSVSISLFLDPELTRTSAPRPEHARIDVFLGDAASRWWNGNGAEYEECTLIPDPPLPPEPFSCVPRESEVPGVRWQAVKDFTVAEFSATSIELRIAREMLGEWTETDGLMIAELRRDGADEYPAPGDALWDAPSTWPRVTYTDDRATLPTAVVAGRVLDVSFGGSALVAGQRVILSSATSTVDAETDASGRFHFWRPVPAGAPVRLTLETCTDCRYEDPAVLTAGILPVSTGPLEVVFPGCDEGECSYAEVDFRLRRPPGPVGAMGFAPQWAAPGIILRESPEKRIAPDVVTVHGSNLHREIELHIQPSFCREVPPLSDCADRVLPVEIESFSDDGRTVQIRLPDVDSFSPGEQWTIVIRNGWTGTGVPQWVRVPGTLRFAEPPYPLIHGLGFDNEGFRPRFRHLLSTFGKNAYFCAGIPRRDGRCIGCRLPRPTYVLYYAVFAPWIAASDGSCVGMAATSLLLANGDLRPADFSSLVHYAGGFTGRGSARFDIDLCGPPDPLTLAAVVETNHGVQTSAEYIFEYVHQATSSTGFGDGDPRRVLADVRENLLERIVCLRDGGDGHCVTPWAIEEVSDTQSRIWVYDNNDPCDGSVLSDSHACVTTRCIEVDTALNSFTFTHGDDTWRGRRIYSLPLSLFRRGRHAPFDPRVVRTLPVEVLRLLLSGAVLFTFGGADGLYVTPEGDRFGRAPDGTFVEEMPGAIPLVPMTGPDSTTPMPFFLADPPPALDVELSGRGGDYTLFASRGGRLMSLQVLDSRPGDADTARLETDGEGRLEFLLYAASREGTRVLPALGMAFDETEEVVFRWGGIAVGAGDEALFRVLPEERGVEFHNLTGRTSTHTIAVEIAVDGADAASLGLFGPFEVPEGAVHRVTVDDWPDGASLLSALDVDGDGVFDEAGNAVARACNPPEDGFEDCNRNGIHDACELELGLAADANRNGVPDECEGEPQDFRLEVGTSEVDSCGSVSVLLEATEPVGGLQLGLAWEPRELVDILEIVPGRAIPEDGIQAFFVNLEDPARGVGPGEAVIGLLLEPGVTIGPASALEILEIRLRRAAGAPVGENVAICPVDGLGVPPIDVALSVIRDRDAVSVAPETSCGAVTLIGDAVSPEIECPDEDAITIEPTPNGAVVTWEVIAIDDCGEEVNVTCEPPSGSVFPAGTTTVVCRAIDAAGNVARCEFEVAVGPPPGRFRRGDGNADGRLDISDGRFLLDHLFLGGRAPRCPDSADANDDGRLDVSDPLAVLNYLFLGSRPPPDPGPQSCGEDPTADELGDCEYDGC